MKMILSGGMLVLMALLSGCQANYIR
ncbi:TPA: colicin R system lysis protein, partial [Escherichia coli]